MRVHMNKDEKDIIKELQSTSLKTFEEAKKNN